MLRIFSEKIRRGAWELFRSSRIAWRIWNVRLRMRALVSSWSGCCRCLLYLLRCLKFLVMSFILRPRTNDTNTWYSREERCWGTNAFSVLVGDRTFRWRQLCSQPEPCCPGPERHCFTMKFRIVLTTCKKNDNEIAGRCRTVKGPVRIFNYKIWIYERCGSGPPTAGYSGAWSGAQGEGMSPINYGEVVISG